MMNMNIPVMLPLGYPKHFYVKPDDCIEKLTINSKEVNSTLANYCDYSSMGRLLDLSPYLIRGQNTFAFRIRDHGGVGGVKLTPGRTDTFPLALDLSVVLLVALYGVSLMFLSAKKPSSRTLFLIFLGGSILRILYFFATPYGTRAHDAGAHLDYVKYVATHFTIPPASQGWEFHQAPLYYFLSGFWMRLGQLAGQTEEVILRGLQLQSILFSIVTLAIGILLGMQLFPGKKKMPALLFASLLATFPAIFYISAEISNNVLYNLFVFLLLFLLVRWWKSGRPRDWHLLLLVFAASFVTRVSALLFFPVIFLSLFLRHDPRPKEKVRLIFLSALFLLFACGWLPYVRLIHEQNPRNSFTLGSQSMHSGLAVPTSANNFLVFSPAKVLKLPYPNPWTDATRRQYFWEYFFRSAFFGEFSFPTELKGISILMIFCGLALLPYLFYGFWKEFWKRNYETIPLWLSFFAILGAQIAYRLYAPFSANQDFRFSIALLPIVAFMTLSGILNAQKYCRSIGIFSLLLLSSLSAAFLVILFVSG